MADSTCSVDGCDRPTQARGWCNTHYGRWRTKGDPGAAETRRYGTASCSVEDCGRRHFAHGWCKPHYRAVKEHGTPVPRRRAEVVDGKRICPRCKVDRPLSDWGASSWCNPCNREHVAGYRVPVATWDAACEVCGKTFQATKRQRFTCSTECKRKRINRENGKYVLRYRAAQRATVVEVIRPRDIFERDGWVCGICSQAVDATVTAPHPKSPSIDHIVPLSRGGTHTRDNLQTAHLGCNCRKGARLLEEVV